MQLGLPLSDPDPREQRVYVRRRRARRYILRVDAESRVLVTIPRGGSQREADAFIARQADWIAQQRARLAGTRRDAVDHDRLRRQAALDLPRRLHTLAEILGLTVTRVSIRDQQTRWGSCGRDGHICLNWRLVAMPDSVRDYVLIHELMHLRRMDHSPAFWQLVAAACPGHAEARRWLRLHGASLR